MENAELSGDRIASLYTEVTTAREQASAIAEKLRILRSQVADADMELYKAESALGAAIRQYAKACGLYEFEPVSKLFRPNQTT